MQCDHYFGLRICCWTALVLLLPIDCMLHANPLHCDSSTTAIYVACNLWLFAQDHPPPAVVAAEKEEAELAAEAEAARLREQKMAAAAAASAAAPAKHTGKRGASSGAASAPLNVQKAVPLMPMFPVRDKRSIAEIQEELKAKRMKLDADAAAADAQHSFTA